MAFTELSNVPLRQIDTVIEVVRKGDGSHEADDVVVTSTLEITGDIAAEEAVLLLPMASGAQFKPLVRYTTDNIKKASFEFDDADRSDLDEAVIKRLEAIGDGASKKEQRALATAISRAARSFSQAVIKVQPGQRQDRRVPGADLKRLVPQVH